jgi:hypothetical protein
VITGFTAWFTKSSLMLPEKKWAKPVLPWVHNPIKSASIELEKLRIPSLYLDHCKCGFTVVLILKLDMKSLMISSESRGFKAIRCTNHY